MNGVGDEFLPGARLAVDQHAPIGRSHECDLLAQGLHRNAIADDDALCLELLFKIYIFPLQVLRFDCVFYQDEGLLHPQRLFQEVVSPQFCGPDGGLNGAVAGDHDHLRRILPFADFRQSVEAVHAG